MYTTNLKAEDQAEVLMIITEETLKSRERTFKITEKTLENGDATALSVNKIFLALLEAVDSTFCESISLLKFQPRWKAASSIVLLYRLMKIERIYDRTRAATSGGRVFAKLI